MLLGILWCVLVTYLLVGSPHVEDPCWELIGFLSLRVGGGYAFLAFVRSQGEEGRRFAVGHLGASLVLGGMGDWGMIPLALGGLVVAPRLVLDKRTQAVGDGGVAFSPQPGPGIDP